MPDPTTVSPSRYQILVSNEGLFEVFGPRPRADEIFDTKAAEFPSSQISLWDEQDLLLRFIDPVEEIGGHTVTTPLN